jgi:predicted dienelactone hydrolase
LHSFRVVLGKNKLPLIGSRMNSHRFVMLFASKWMRAALLALALPLSIPMAMAEQAAVLPVAVPPASAPKATPSPEAAALAVQVEDFEWQDTARNRNVPARLYWPQATGNPSVPLVVFSHGLGGSRMGYSYLGKHWAGQGFASLHVQHEGSDRAIWGGTFFERYSKLRTATADDSALARAKDVSFAITALLATGEFGQRINPEAIAVAGHSYGANTALLLAGAKVQYQRKPISLVDARIKAAIILSAPPFHGQGDMQNILAGISIPTLHLTGTEDDINVPGYNSNMQDRVEVFNAVGAKAKLLAVFTGGTHSIFTDRLDRAGPELNKSVKEATREITAAFLRTTLRGESAQNLGDVFAHFRSAFTKTAGALPGLVF